jgi:hypothetical protein
MNNIRSEGARKKVSPKLIEMLSKQTSKNLANSPKNGKLALSKFVQAMDHCLMCLSLAIREIDLMLEISQRIGLSVQIIEKAGRMKQYLQDQEKEIAAVAALWKRFDYSLFLEMDETEISRLPLNLQTMVLPMRDVTGQYYKDLDEARLWIEARSDLAKSFSFALWAVRWSKRPSAIKLFEEMYDMASISDQQPKVVDMLDFMRHRISN